VSAAFAPGSVAAVVARGLRGTVGCAAACTVRVSLVLDAATARRLKARGTATVLATKRVRAAAGAPVTVTLRPAKTLARRLARLRGGRVEVRVEDAATGARLATTAVRLR
jgi:hypothetical protein